MPSWRSFRATLACVELVTRLSERRSRTAAGERDQMFVLSPFVQSVCPSGCNCGLDTCMGRWRLRHPGTLRGFYRGAADRRVVDVASRYLESPGDQLPREAAA